MAPKCTHRGNEWHLEVGLGRWIWAGGLRVAGEVGLKNRTGGRIRAVSGNGIANGYPLVIH